MNNHNSAQPPVPNPETAFGQMTINAQATILANERAAADQAASEAVDLARQDRIDARYNSLELRDLNDAAEVAIFGETGVLASMKENPRYGTKQADREAAAETYKTDVLELVDEGFELTQAKLIMDLRETAEKARADRTKAVRLSATKIMNSSETLDTEAAVARASAFYDKKNTPPLTDEENKALIKEQAIFTNDDYNKVKEGTDLYGEVDEQQNEIAELKKEVEDLEEVVLKGVAALAVDETVKSDILKSLDVTPESDAPPPSPKPTTPESESKETNEIRIRTLTVDGFPANEYSSMNLLSKLGGYSTDFFSEIYLKDEDGNRAVIADINLLNAYCGIDAGVYLDKTDQAPYDRRVIIRKNDTDPKGYSVAPLSKDDVEQNPTISVGKELKGDGLSSMSKVKEIIAVAASKQFPLDFNIKRGNGESSDVRQKFWSSLGIKQRKHNEIEPN